MSGHQAIGPGKALDTSGLEGIGCWCVEAIIGCLVGGSSIGDHAGRAGTSSPGTGNVSIGIAATDTLTAPGGPLLLSFPISTGRRILSGDTHRDAETTLCPRRFVRDDVLYWRCAFSG